MIKPIPQSAGRDFPSSPCTFFFRAFSYSPSSRPRRMRRSRSPSRPMARAAPRIPSASRLSFRHFPWRRCCPAASGWSCRQGCSTRWSLEAPGPAKLPAPSTSSRGFRMEVGSIYDVTGLRIAADLSSASFEFDRAFLQAPGQTFSQFLLTPGPPGVLPIAPEGAGGGVLFHRIAPVWHGDGERGSGTLRPVAGPARLRGADDGPPSQAIRKPESLTAPRVSTPIPRVTRLLVSRTGTENPVQTLWDRNDRRPDLTHGDSPFGGRFASRVFLIC